MNTRVYQQINLYQPIFRRQRQVFSCSTMLQILGIFAVALLTIYWYGRWQVIGLEAEAALLEEREGAYSAQLANLDTSSGLTRRREVDSELGRLTATLVEQQRLINVLAETPLGDTKGFSAYLAALARRHQAGLWLTSMTINGASGAIELVGESLAPDRVPSYLLTLGEEDALAGQRFDDFDIERLEETTRVRFSVSSRSASQRTDSNGAPRR